MDIIDNYLDTMFASYPLTPRTVEAKSELRAMMEDIYNGAIAAGQSRNEAVGQALAEFGNMEEVAALLGDPSGAPIEIAAQFDRNRPAVSMAQARNFAAVSEKTRWLLGWAGLSRFSSSHPPLWCRSASQLPIRTCPYPRP